jgi:predicted CXXCH cytochrome family protein
MLARCFYNADVARRGVRGLQSAAVLALLALAWAGNWTRAERVVLARASDRARDAELPKPRAEGFAGSSSCRACHVEAHASWHASWHRTMTQAVAPMTVLADFDGRRLPHADGEHAVERRGDEFFVWMPDANWLLDRAAGGFAETERAMQMQWQRVVMSTGAHNMQLYWVAAAPGRRLVAFPFTWVVEAQTWVANESTLLRPHEPHVVYSWNEVCLQCHAVAGAPEMSQTRVETEVAELGIACEACHGPARAHVEAQRNPLRRYALHLRGEASDIVHPGRLADAASSEICGQCHSASVFADHATWLGRGSDYRAGAALHEAARVVRHPLRADLAWLDDLLDEDPDYLATRFWGDGMIRISGREYNGLLESPCAVDPEFGCLSCHEMHGDSPDDQLRDIARSDDDRQCTQCHEDLESVAHTRHAAESSGSRCVNCHMPHTTYGLTKAIRSHQISSPSAGETLAVGRINACNACHLDRSLAWTASELERGWQVAPPSFVGEDGVGEDGGVEHEVERAAAVEQLVHGDAGQRILAAWAFGWAPAQATSGTDWMAPLLLRALADDYAAVRWVALRSLRSLPGFHDLDWSLAGALDGQPLSQAAISELERRWPGSARDQSALYLHATGFDAEAWARDHARRDTQVVDLRE